MKDNPELFKDEKTWITDSYWNSLDEERKNEIIDSITQPYEIDHFKAELKRLHAEMTVDVEKKDFGGFEKRVKELKELMTPLAHDFYMLKDYHFYREIAKIYKIFIALKDETLFKPFFIQNEQAIRFSNIDIMGEILRDYPEMTEFVKPNL